MEALQTQNNSNTQPPQQQQQQQQQQQLDAQQTDASLLRQQHLLRQQQRVLRSYKLNEDTDLQRALEASLRDVTASNTSQTHAQAPVKSHSLQHQQQQQQQQNEPRETVSLTSVLMEPEAAMLDGEIDGDLELALKLSLSEQSEADRKRQESVQAMEKREAEELEKILQLSLAEK